MKKIAVNTLTKKHIKHVYVTKFNKQNKIISMVLSLLIVFSVFAVKNFDNNDISKICLKVYNPINPLFNDSGEIVFASSNFNSINKNNLKFITPIKCSEVNINDGDVSYTIDSSIMVVAPEDGIVKEIGYLPNGEKYIEIMHAKGVSTKIENIYITGVIIGQIVAKGKDIATVKLGDVVRFSIYENDIKQTNISLNKNQIEWESLQ